RAQRDERRLAAFPPGHGRVGAEGTRALPRAAWDHDTGADVARDPAMSDVLFDAPALTTERLVLRPWRKSDLDPFAAMNADPRVTATLGGSLNRTESDALAARIATRFRAKGFGQWAVELPGIAPFIGFIGLAAPD